MWSYDSQRIRLWFLVNITEISYNLGMNLLRDAEQYKLVLNIFSTYIQFADILKVFSFIFRLDVIFKDSKHIYFRIHMWIEEEKKSVSETSCVLSVFIITSSGESIQYQKSIIVILSSSRLLWCLYCVYYE